MFKALDEQQETLQSDADNLADLQTQATSAQGKWKLFRPLTSLPVLKRTSCCKSARFWYPNKNAAATLAQAQADKEAQQIVADEKALAGKNTPSPKRIW